MYITTVCLSLDHLVMKVSQCWLDDLNSIPGKGDGIPVFTIRSKNISRVNRTSYTRVQLLFHRCGRGRYSHSFPSLRRHHNTCAHRVGDPCFRASVCTRRQAIQTKTELYRAIRPAFQTHFILDLTENGKNNQAIGHKGLMRHYTHNLAVVRSFHKKNKHTHKHTPNVPEFCSKYKRIVSAGDKSLQHLTPPFLWKTNPPKESTDRKNKQWS